MKKKEKISVYTKFYLYLHVRNRIIIIKLLLTFDMSWVFVRYTRNRKFGGLIPQKLQSCSFAGSGRTCQLQQPSPLLYARLRRLCNGEIRGPSVDPSAVARLGIYHTRARACRPILAATFGDNRADKRARWTTCGRRSVTKCALDETIRDERASELFFSLIRSLRSLLITHAWSLPAPLTNTMCIFVTVV